MMEDNKKQKMIHRIYSSVDTFKALEFHKGLNILSAVRTAKSSDRQTRNGAGKSSFVAIVNMLLGGTIGKNSIFKHEALLDYWFGMEFDLRSNRTSVKRSGKPRSGIMIKPDDALGIEKSRQSAFIEDDFRPISSRKWTEILGKHVFDLPVGEEYESLGRFKPTFRSLVSYFAREHPNGFITYEKYFAQGPKYQYQVPLSFILGIDWRISQDLQELRTEEAENIVPDFYSSAELRTTIVIKERRREELETTSRIFVCFLSIANMKKKQMK